MAQIVPRRLTPNGLPGPRTARNATPTTMVGRTNGTSVRARRDRSTREAIAGEDVRDGQTDGKGDDGRQERLPQGEPGHAPERWAGQRLAERRGCESAIRDQPRVQDREERVDEEIAEKDRRDRTDQKKGAPRLHRTITAHSASQRSRFSSMTDGSIKTRVGGDGGVLDEHVRQGGFAVRREHEHVERDVFLERACQQEVDELLGGGLGGGSPEDAGVLDLSEAPIFDHGRRSGFELAVVDLRDRRRRV